MRVELVIISGGGGFRCCRLSLLESTLNLLRLRLGEKYERVRFILILLAGLRCREKCERVRSAAVVLLWCGIASSQFPD